MNNCSVLKDEVSGESYTSFTHASGVTVYVYPKRLTTSYAMFGARYGSLERTFRLTGEEWLTVPDGVAHFLEHKLFEEEDGSDVFERFAALGASANAFTSNELTCYLFSTTASVYEPLKELISFVMRPYFTEQNVKKEMGIIGQEINMYDDMPYSRLNQATLEGLYSTHNIRVNIAGTKETISHITPEVLYRCYNTFYHPSNMVLTVVGNVEIERVEGILDEFFGTEKKAPLEVERSYPEEHSEVGKEYTEFSMQVAKPLLSVSFKDEINGLSTKEKQRHAYAVHILLKLFFSRSSAFYNDLYRRGLITDSFSPVYEWLDSCAHTVIFAESDLPNEVFEAIESYMSSISSEMLDISDFNRVKRALYAENIKTLDSTEDIAYNLTDAAIHGLTLWDAGEAIRSVSFEEIQLLADTYFKNKHLVRVLIKPSEA